MKVVFIVDTSASMHAKSEDGLTYVDMAVGAIETFVVSRSKSPAYSGDKYFLLSTAEQYPQMILSSWEHTIDHFLDQLKQIKTCRTMNALHVALGYAFSLLGQFRGQGAQSDIVTGGRLVAKSETVLVH